MDALQTVARRLQLPRGAWHRPGGGGPPERPLELYGFEACASCRRVRQVLCELGLDYLHRSCPWGEARNRKQLEARGGKVQLPYLIDPNLGVELYESAAIVEHLERHYGGGGHGGSGS